MPVVIREGSWRVWIWTADHGQPHVHVHLGSASVKVLLPTRDAPAIPIGRGKMSNREMTQAVRLVEKHAEQLLLAWSAIHGVPKADG